MIYLDSGKRKIPYSNEDESGYFIIYLIAGLPEAFAKK